MDMDWIRAVVFTPWLQVCMEIAQNTSHTWDSKQAVAEGEYATYALLIVYSGERLILLITKL